jgi:hypothetical protein
MAKLSAHGHELFRFFSPRSQGLKSVRSDGHTLIRYPGTGWKLFSRRDPKIPYDEWLAKKTEIYNKMPTWAKAIESLPSMEQIREWTFDAVCETTDGETCEPDSQGWADHGPSWLVALGYL